MRTITPRATREDTDMRVMTIEALMRELKWVRGKSNRELARKWDVSVANVNNLASEASRRVRLAITDRDEVQTTVCSAMHTIVHDGMALRDYRSVIKAGDVWTRIVGARAPERHEVSQVEQEVEAMTPADKALWCREKAAELLLEAERLDEMASSVHALEAHIEDEPA
jgi:hypothetical protein